MISDIEKDLTYFWNKNNHVMFDHYFILNYSLSLLKLHFQCIYWMERIKQRVICYFQNQVIGNVTQTCFQSNTLGK